MNYRANIIGKRILAAATVACGVTLLASQANAIVIGFESSEGYTTGILTNQPPTSGATKWTGDTAGNYIVTAVGSGQAVTTVAGGSSTVNYHPSSIDLGLSAGQTLANTIISYSFDISVNEIEGTSGTHTLFRPRLGGTSGGSVISDFELSSANGLFRFSAATVAPGSSAGVAKNASGGNFVATAGTSFTVSGELDFSTSTFTLFVNGVQQKDANNNSTLGFRTTGLTDLYLWMQLITNNSGDATFTIDNIKLTAVPEAASIGILSLGALALLKRTKKS